MASLPFPLSWKWILVAFSPSGNVHVFFPLFPSASPNLSSQPTYMMAAADSAC